MQIFKPPEFFNLKEPSLSIFLAGSIRNGKVVDWQQEVQNRLSEFPDDLLTILNPRRLAYDQHQEKSSKNPYFKDQVLWELKGLDTANIIFMYFEPSSKAPITLFELGLYAGKPNLIVVCPDGYWRKGNVDIICEIYKIKLFETFDEGINELLDIIDYEKGYMFKNLYNEWN